MGKQMLINATRPENIRVAITSEGLLDIFFTESQDRFRVRGNIYLGKVSSVQPSLEACFVDYGENKHGFLPMDEIIPTCYAVKAKDSRPPRIEEVVKPHQMILVQVSKEPVGEKGARLTSEVSLAGRYLVLMPFSDKHGVSKKIEDPETRRKLLDIGTNLNPPKGMGFILRTAVMNQTRRTLARDLNYLVRLWKDITTRARKNSQNIRLLYPEADIVQRVLRDYFTIDIEQVWIDDPATMERAKSVFKLFIPKQLHKLKLYTEKTPIFSAFDVEPQIESIHGRKVNLPSGGSLVVEQTEALVSVDVNSGKTKGQRLQEELAFKTNLEAASEVSRQLCLRNLGGIIVIDFIDMQEAKHRTEVERKLRESMRNDKARHQIGKISSFGLCTLTRQQLDQSIRLIGYRECPLCKGDGVIRSNDTIAVQLLRNIQTKLVDRSIKLVRIVLPPEIATYIQNKYRRDILNLERDFNTTLEIQATDDAEYYQDHVEYIERENQKQQTDPNSPNAQPTPDSPNTKQPTPILDDSTTSTGKNRRRRHRSHRKKREEV